ncbi:MAG: DsbA family protein [Clostridiaceae bacterium]
MKHTMKIFADYTCPFCFLGKGMVDQLKKEFEIEVNWMPFEIHPEVPLLGMKITDAFPDSTAEEMLGSFNAKGNQYGVYYSGKDAMFNSHKALLATEYARDNGKLAEFHSEVFKAYFTDSINISDTQVLKEIATRVGLDADEMMQKVEDHTYEARLTQSIQAGEAYGVEYIPTFIIDDQHILIGAQPIEAYREALLKQAN